MKVSLEGKRAVVTAGGSGMGRATVLAMHAMGAKVSTCDINGDLLKDLPSEVAPFVCDVSDADAVDEMFDQVLADGLDILVNNAGVGGPTKRVEDISVEEWRNTMAVGIDSQFLCARRVIPVFREQKAGVIINMISAAGIMGYPNRTPYASAKWAATGFTKTLAMEVGPANIRVNGIVPGNVKGERIERVIKAHADKDGLAPEEVRRLYALSTSMQCYIEPEEISDLICFLCSDYGKHISGQIIAVDGNTETLYPRM